MPYEQAETLNNLGELLIRSSDSRHARVHYRRRTVIDRVTAALGHHPAQPRKPEQGTAGDVMSRVLDVIHGERGAGQATWRQQESGFRSTLSD